MAASKMLFIACFLQGRCVGRCLGSCDSCERGVASLPECLGIHTDNNTSTGRTPSISRHILPKTTSYYGCESSIKGRFPRIFLFLAELVTSFFWEMIDRWRQFCLHRLLRPSTTSCLVFLRPFSASHTLQAKKKKMPPKKAAAAEKKVLLGRPSNNLKIGIVGMRLSSCNRIQAQYPSI
jgi:hypothetical protein